MIKLFLISLTFITLLVISSCEKKPSDSDKKLLDTWVSTDLIDTIEIKTEHDFYKTLGIPGDHFNYSVLEDSMRIQYYGVLKILVQPTYHFYTLTGDRLTIDLEHCYGFRSQIISFTRK